MRARIPILALLTVLFLTTGVFAQEERSERRRGDRNRGERTSEGRSERGSAVAADTVSTATLGSGLAAFQILMQRNIFDPERSVRRPREEQSEARRVEAPPPVPEHINLRGVWLADEQHVAFIDGNKMEGSKQIGVGHKINGWEVASISTSQIVLARGDETVSWPVGQRIVASGENWNVAGFAETAPAGRSESRSASRNQGSAAPASGASSDEILQRLMERRQRESGR